MRYKSLEGKQMTYTASRFAAALGVALTLLATSRLAADPIYDASYFDSIAHTHLTFETDGSGATLPVLSNLTLPADEYASQGVTVLPQVRAVRDSDACFRLVQDIAGGSTPYGLSASQTSSFEFDPPVKAFGFVFVAIFFQNATFTAYDGDNNLIETAVFTGPFIDSGGCGFLEYGFVGIESETPIARVTVAAFSGAIDNLRFAAAEEDDADDDGVVDEEDNCPNVANPDQADADGDGLGDACDACPNDADNDADGDGVCGNVDNCPGDANADQADLDGDSIGDACDDDIDGDGLSNDDEATFGTNPLVPDSDGDGLLDGTEVDMAMGSGCPDPLNADSDGDDLSDGHEALTMGTSPCNADTDGDGIDDNEDPLPLQPGVSQGFIESLTRQTGTTVLALNLNLFNGPNANANKGRRAALANRATDAANHIANGNYAAAQNELLSLLDKIDDVSPPPDWLDPSPEKTELADYVRLLITLLDFF